MSTNDNVDDNIHSTQNQYDKITKIFTRRAAFGILVLSLAVGLTPIPNALAQTAEQGPDLGQTTTDSLIDQSDEPRRLSILGALGISLIEEVKVTAIALNEDATEVTVTVSRVDNATRGTLFDDNRTGTTNPSITVAAFRTQLDLASLLQAHMGKGQQMPMHPDHGFGRGDTIMQEHRGSMSGGMPMFDIMSFIEGLEIGSNIEEEGWTSPTELTIPVISSEEGTNTIPDTTGTNATSDTEVVVVVVIPYTGEAATTAQAAGQLPTDVTD
ncbi:MAG: hypothetical protein AB1351_03190 [Thermoproteota archaeon]